MQNDAGLDLRTLFWKTVPVALRRTDRIVEDQYVQLNVRLLAGYAQNTETLKASCSRHVSLHLIFLKRCVN